MYDILRSAHSGWRYVVLLLLVLATIQAVAGWLGSKPYTEGNRKLNVFALISAHIQLLLGLALYFLGDWFSGESSVPLARYWKMEHIGMMIFAIILITVGNARSKRFEVAQAKHRAISIYFGLAVVVIIAAIIAMTKADPTRSFFGVS
ncbi:cytochrome B [Pedobacter faecalis]|uniref:cytochrome B n=1 Tax=Pedobacter faecalis TaxID=3041495 RepID=UPI00254CFDB9|nr:cytochrome B [Pedobacter sp. ELA7]